MWILLCFIIKTFLREIFIHWISEFFKKKAFFYLTLQKNLGETTLTSILDRETWNKHSEWR